MLQNFSLRLGVSVVVRVCVHGDLQSGSVTSSVDFLSLSVLIAQSCQWYLYWWRFDRYRPVFDKLETVSSRQSVFFIILTFWLIIANL